MNELKEVLQKLKDNKNVTEKGQICRVLINAFMGKGNNRLTNEDAEELRTFAVAEAEELIKLIPQATGFKETDVLLEYEDTVMGLFSVLISHKYEPSIAETEIIKTLLSIAERANSFENGIQNMLEKGEITEDGIIKAIGEIKDSEDEYRRGRLWVCLLNFNPRNHKIAEGAKAELVRFADSELERLLKKADSLSEDQIDNLEILGDVCKHFAAASTLDLLNKCLDIKNNNIRYYIVNTLLGFKREIPVHVIDELARDVCYADLTYSMLQRYGKASLFPADCTSPEYLAESDMVHWLTYPTELGKKPDEIELLGTVKSHGELYYVFKYKSDSDNLGDDVKNKWLIGWSSNNGGTFSNFDELSPYEGKDLKKTLKTIKKKLIG